MRKFTFNTFRKDEPSEIREKPATQPSPTPGFGAYRTIISRHEAMAERLKNEPSAPIPPKDNV